MAALSYLFLPFSGMIAYFLGGTPRVRFHGLQAVILGVVWPVLLYGCSALSATLTQAAFVAGGAVWLGVMVGAALGKDPRLPVIGRACARAVDLDPT